MKSRIDIEPWHITCLARKDEDYCGIAIPIVPAPEVARASGIAEEAAAGTSRSEWMDE